ETFAPLRAQGHVRVAAKAALFHVAVVDADRHQDLAYGAHVRGGLLARSQIGLTHDLDERRSRTVQIDGRGALDPVQVLAGVFFQVHPGDACGERRAIDLEVDPPVLAERQLVLADLVALRQVRIKVVLASEDAALVDRAAQGQRRAHTETYGLLVDRGQGARQAQANGAHVAVRRSPEVGRTPAEQLGASRELRVDLESDDWFVFRGHARLLSSRPV